MTTGTAVAPVMKWGSGGNRHTWRTLRWTDPIPSGAKKVVKTYGTTRCLTIKECFWSLETALSLLMGRDAKPVYNARVLVEKGDTDQCVQAQCTTAIFHIDTILCVDFRRTRPDGCTKTSINTAYIAFINEDLEVQVNGCQTGWEEEEESNLINLKR